MRPLDAPLLYRLVREGREPGELLSPYDRRILIRNMHREGATDQDIALVTRWTLFTVARLRDELGLPPNHRPRNHPFPAQKAG
ncbi:hypothetical protein CSW53_18120 [Rhodococcus ruber]|nr:hypothetical protein CSW53_18120 [Rhodococcus ruber]